MIFTVTPIESDVKIKEDSGSSWKQLFLSFLATLPFFAHGLQTADLSQNFQFIVVPPTEVPWTATSQILASVVFTPIFCCTIDKYGRKFGLYLAIMSQGVSCIPLFLPPNDISSIFVHITTGITYVGIFITIPIYIREMNNDTRRGTMIAVTMVMLSLGKICATMMEFENLIYLIVAMVTLEFLALFLIVETPSYFVMMKQIEKASETFGRLKSIKKEDEIVSKEINNLNDESRRAKDKGNLNLYRILKHVIWRDCTKIGLVLYTVTTLCGCSIFLDHRKTLLQLKLDQAPDDVLVYVILMAGSGLTFILISFLERKYLLSLSYFTTAFFMGILAVFTQADLTVTELRWLPQVCLAVIIFAYGMSWGLPLILMTEMYNLQIRSRLLGLLFIYSQALNLIHLHTLKYIEELMGIYTMFYVFSSVNLFGAVYSLFKIPAVKNKSVKKIEKLLKNSFNKIMI